MQPGVDGACNRGVGLDLGPHGRADGGLDVVA